MITYEDLLTAIAVFVVSTAGATYNFASIVTRADANLPGNWAWGVGFSACALISFVLIAIGLVKVVRDR